MKLRLFSIALLAMLSVGVLAGCNPSNPSSEVPPSSETSSEEPSSEEPSSSEESSEANPVTAISISNKSDFDAANEWRVGDTGRKIELNVEPAMNIATALKNGHIVITSSNPEVASVAGQMVSPVAVGTATITVTAGDLSDSVDVTVLEYVDPTSQSLTIAEVREMITNGEIKTDDEVSFRGRIVATFEPTTGDDGHVYSGVFLQDGAYGMMLYAGKLSELWDEHELEIGDEIVAAGKYSPYSGLDEFKPSAISMYTGSEKIADPIPVEVTAANYNATALRDYQSGLFTCAEAIYVSGKIEDVSEHASITFKLPGVDGGDDVEATVRTNYHLGTTAMTALKEEIDALNPGDVVSLTGNIGWYNGPQFQPVFMDGKTPADCITFLREGTLPAPTSITIKGDAEVEAGKNITLTAEVAPEGSDPNVTWSSSDETIATVENGVVTGVAKGTATITATSVADETVKATHEVEVITVDSPFVPAKAAVANTEYILTAYHTNINKQMHLTGEMDGTYLATSEDLADAATIVLEETDGGFHLSVTKVGGTKTYLNGAHNGKYVEMSFDAEAKSVFTYDAELDILVLTIEEEGYCLNTRSDKTFDTYGLSTTKYASTNICARLHIVKPLEVKAPVANVSYYLGSDQNNTGKRLYSTGAMSGNYGATTENYKEAASFMLVETTGGYHIKVNDSQYLNIATSTNDDGTKTYYNVNFAAEATTVWTYNAKYNTMTSVVDDTERYIGTYGTYNTLSVSAISYADGSFPTHFYSLSVSTGEEGGDTPAVTGQVSIDPTSLTAKGSDISADCTDFIKGITSNPDAIKSAASSKAYNGNGSGGAFEQTPGLLKFGTSKVDGSLTLELNGEVTKVVIKAHDFYSISEKYPTTSNTISVNGVELGNPYTADATPADLVFELTEASSSIEILFNGRAVVFGITLYFAE